MSASETGLKGPLRAYVARLLASEGPGIVARKQARVHRNVAGLRFPASAVPDELAELTARLLELVKSPESPLPLAGWWADELPVPEQRLLAQLGLVSESTGASAIALDQEGRVAVALQQSDHVEVAVPLVPGEEADSLALLGKLENWLEEQVGFAISTEFGYLTSEPYLVGTGFRVSFQALLTAVGALEEVAQARREAEHAGCVLVQRPPDDDFAAYFQVASRQSLGISEEKTLELIDGLACELTAQELRAREHLQASERLNYEDTVYRAWGLLTNCRLLDEQEALQLLADLSLGAGMPNPLYVDGGLIQELAFKVQVAWLEFEAGEELEPAEADWRRAIMVRQAFGMV